MEREDRVFLNDGMGKRVCVDRGIVRTLGTVVKTCAIANSNVRLHSSPNDPWHEVRCI